MSENLMHYFNNISRIAFIDNFRFIDNKFGSVFFAYQVWLKSATAFQQTHPTHTHTHTPPTLTHTKSPKSL